MRILTIAAALLSLATAARADDPAPGARYVQPPLSTLDCMTILSGLNSLNWQGQQLGQAAPTPTPITPLPSYKLGTTRLTISRDVDMLSTLAVSINRAQNGYIAELPLPFMADPGKALTQEQASANSERERKIQKNWNELMDKMCDVPLKRIQWSELHVGDGTDQNAIPPAVLGAIMKIIENAQ